MLGLGLGSMLQLQAAAKESGKGGGAGWGQAKSVILMFLQGGPSHIDLWDPKENVPDNVRSPFKTISTKQPGVKYTAAIFNQKGFERADRFYPKIDVRSRGFATAVEVSDMHLVYVMSDDDATRPARSVLAQLPRTELDGDAAVGLDFGTTNSAIAAVGRDGVPDLDFYLAFHLFRTAGIMFGIAGRAKAGTAAGAQAAELGRAAAPLAERALSLARGLGA